MSSDRSWMYARHKEGILNADFLRGLNKFFEFAKQHPECMEGDKLKCPCNHRKCQNRAFLDEETIRLHLMKHGFIPHYYQWYVHGEPYDAENREDRRWMYFRLKEGFLNPEFLQGLNKFIEFAKQHPECMDGNKLRCPCKFPKCQHVFADESMVKYHLMKYGFAPYYYQWYMHGEPYGINVNTSNKLVEQSPQLQEGYGESPAMGQETLNHQAVGSEKKRRVCEVRSRASHALSAHASACPQAKELGTELRQLRQTVEQLQQTVAALKERDQQREKQVQDCMRQIQEMMTQMQS
ncbi:uncharacterized protein LOC110613202 isoform X3 [Manihot esculenta]|nr:uncharacterized protein LOC110613202 isoform X3 [Manihot esculenta]